MRFIILSIFIFTLTLASAQELEKGNEAYKNRDLALAFEYFKKACDKNKGEACYRIGDMYDIGLEVSKDEAKAMNYFERACKLGYKKACSTIKDRDESLRGGW